jgi:GDP-L-fucose synthase
MNLNSKIYIAGHNGMVGSAIKRKLELEGYNNIITRTSSELNLINQSSVSNFFELENPEYVFLCAAKVGGILANNDYKANFIYENIMIQSNIIHSSYLYNVKKLLFLGSSCIYPKNAPQPLKEDYLLTGLLETTNDAYAIAKISGIKMCEAYRKQYNCNFISVMPTNLYGKGDSYNLNTSHVLPALIRKIHEAKINKSPYVEVWGDGKPKREFLNVDDLADACYFLMNNYNDSEIINIGCGEDITITELVHIIKGIIGYNGDIKYLTNKPNGTMRKVLDVTKINNLGWKSKIDLITGIRKVYNEFKNEINSRI